MISMTSVLSLWPHLPVLFSVSYCPRNLGRPLALVEQGSCLPVEEQKLLHEIRALVPLAFEVKT